MIALEKTAEGLDCGKRSRPVKPDELVKIVKKAAPAFASFLERNAIRPGSTTAYAQDESITGWNPRKDGFNHGKQETNTRDQAGVGAPLHRRSSRAAIHQQRGMARRPVRFSCLCACGTALALLDQLAADVEAAAVGLAIVDLSADTGTMPRPAVGVN